MPLRDLKLFASDSTPSAPALRLIREAEKRIRRFQSDCRVMAFVPCDYPTAFTVLRGLSESSLARGSRFCEWGSGFGVVASLAAMLGFDACGIEIESSLVEEARQLADDFELPVEFVHGSFVPRGAEDRVHSCCFYDSVTT